MAVNDYSRFVDQFTRRLLLAPAECRREEGAVYWIDPRQRVNWCWIENWAPEEWMRGLLLARISVNLRAPEALRPNLPAMRRRPGWEGIDRAQPRWNRQVTCHREELEPIGQWLADFVNRREGIRPLASSQPVVVPMANDEDGSVTSGYYWTRAAHAGWKRAEARRIAARQTAAPVGDASLLNQQV